MSTFLATARNGELDYGSDENKARLRQYLLDHEGKTFRTTLPKTQRSLSQNNYYWMYLGVIEQETGNSADDLHEYFKRKFIPPKFTTVLGRELKLPRSTTELNKVEFGEYMDKICALTGVPLPDPELAGYITNY